MSDDAPRMPFVEVLPPHGEENAQPLQSTVLEVSGGGLSPLTIDFYYVSLNGYRRVFRGDQSPDIERKSDDHIVIRSRPVASVTVSVALAADLIIALYQNLQNETARRFVDERLIELQASTGPQP
jgi:hypothetical protein